MMSILTTHVSVLNRLQTVDRTVIMAGVGVLLFAVSVAWLYRRFGRDRDPRTAGRQVGQGVGDTLTAPLRFALRFGASAGYSFARSLTRLLPKSEAMWRGVIKRGFRGLYKSTGGNPDAVGLIHRENNQLDIVPVKWTQGDPDDPTDPPRWKTKDGEEWHPGAEGRDTDHIGPTPVALFDEDAETKGSFLQSRFSAALDLGHQDKLFVPETVQQVNIEVDGQEALTGGPDAIADGGAVQSETVYEIPDSEWPGKLADVLVDLGTPGDYGGMRISAKQYKEAYQEKVGSEEMQMQELRGRAAEADPNASKAEIKRLIYAILGTVLVVKSPEILSVIFGGGVGDSLGGAVPSFTILPPVWELFATIPL